MSSTTLPAIVTGPAPPAQLARGIEPVMNAVEALKAIRTFVASELKPGVDFGLIPGTGDKPTLLKPGAEKIALYYQTRISYAIDRMELGDGHIEFQVRCDLLARSNGATASEGYGSCCTMESKYRWRKADRVCPLCGQPSIIKGREEYGGGWLCFAKKGGCGAKYHDGDQSIEGQQTGRVENVDVWDSRNTCLKMGLKRALVSAVLSLGSLSELFTQDVEDIYDLSPGAPERPQASPEPPPVTKPAAKPATAGSRQTGSEWLAKQVKAAEASLFKDFDGVPSDLLPNLFRAERHVCKAVTGRSTEGLRNADVRHRLDQAFGNDKTGFRKVVDEYLRGVIAEAHRQMVGAALDKAGETTPTVAVEADSDPEVDYEHEPGSDG